MAKRKSLRQRAEEAVAKEITRRRRAKRAAASKPKGQPAPKSRTLPRTPAVNRPIIPRGSSRTMADRIAIEKEAGKEVGQVRRKRSKRS